MALLIPLELRHLDYPLHVRPLAVLRCLAGGEEKREENDQLGHRISDHMNGQTSHTNQALITTQTVRNTQLNASSLIISSPVP